MTRSGVAALAMAAASLAFGVVLVVSFGTPAHPGDTPAPASSPPASPVAAAPSPGQIRGPGGCTVTAPSPAPRGLSFVVCYRMTGEVTAQGGFVDAGQGAGALSCAAWAAGGDRPAGATTAVLFLPDPGDAGVRVNGRPISFYLEIGSFAGPGTYGRGQVAESVSYGTVASWSTNADLTATFSAEVARDGSGTVTAGALRNDASTGGTETVTESWTCSAGGGA